MSNVKLLEISCHGSFRIRTFILGSGLCDYILIHKEHCATVYLFIAGRGLSSYGVLGVGLGGVLGICRSNNRGGVGCLAGSVNKKSAWVNTGLAQKLKKNP